MEEALKRCEGKGEFVIFSCLHVYNGIVKSDPNYKSCRSFMPIREFLEMIFDMISNSMPIDVSNIHTELTKADFLRCDKYVMGKYVMHYFYAGVVITSANITTLEPILGTNLYNYLKDDFKRHVLLIKVNNIKEEIEEFIKTQASFDDVSKFEKIINAIE